MVLEQVGGATATLLHVLALGSVSHSPLPLLDALPFCVSPCLPPCTQFYATSDYKHFSDALAALLQLDALKCGAARALWGHGMLFCAAAAAR